MGPPDVAVDPFVACTSLPVTTGGRAVFSNPCAVRYELTVATLPARMGGMSRTLPPWVVDDVASVRAEVAEWAGLTAQERWRLARLCARDAMWAARASGNPERILDYVDPLPASTVVALARLRREAKHHDGDS